MPERGWRSIFHFIIIEGTINCLDREHPMRFIMEFFVRMSKERILLFTKEDNEEKW